MDETETDLTGDDAPLGAFFGILGMQPFQVLRSRTFTASSELARVATTFRQYRNLARTEEAQMRPETKNVLPSVFFLFNIIYDVYSMIILA